MKTRTFRDAMDNNFTVAFNLWPQQLTILTRQKRNRELISVIGVISIPNARKLAKFLNDNLKNAKKRIKLPRTLDGEVEN